LKSLLTLGKNQEIRRCFTYTEPQFSPKPVPKHQWVLKQAIVSAGSQNDRPDGLKTHNFEIYGLNLRFLSQNLRFWESLCFIKIMVPSAG
jgi:hypothetical protein